MSTSYLDIRIRLHLKEAGIINAHLLAVPVYVRHTAQAIFNTATKALDVLCPSWRDIIVGISTDGERKMTGRVSGVATRFRQAAKPGFIQIWCGAHQLDLVLQNCYVHFGNEVFYQQLTAVISYLRRQQNLVAEIRTKAPKIADTRWESMYGVSLWFKLHKIALDEYFQSKRPACAPPPIWWAQLMVVQYFASQATVTFKALQGHDVTVAMQHSRLARLIEFYLNAVDGNGPLQEVEAAELDADWVFSNCRRFAAPVASAENLVLNQGSFVLDKIESVPEAERESFFKDVAFLFVDAAARIAMIVPERD